MNWDVFECDSMPKPASKQGQSGLSLCGLYPIYGNNNLIKYSGCSRVKIFGVDYIKVGSTQ